MSPAAWLLLIQLLKVSSTDFKQVAHNTKIISKIVIKVTKKTERKITHVVKQSISKN